MSDLIGALDQTLWALDSFGVVWNLWNGTWNRTIQPTGLQGATSGQEVTEVVSGQHELGAQYAFYTIGGILYWSIFQETAGVYGGYWTPPTQVLYESEKNTPMNTTQIHRNSTGWNSPPRLEGPVPGAPPPTPRRRHPPANTRSAEKVQGMLPARNTPPKNHQGC